VHHQPAADHLQRQLAGAGEGQQHQHLVAGEGEPVRLERLVEAGQQDLLHPEDAGRRAHRGGRAEVLLPALRRALDRVEGQAQRSHHGCRG
jgi:hypothetical protein